MKKLAIGSILLLAVIGVPRLASAVGLEPVPVPEPATALLLAAGVLGMAAFWQRKR
jgi:hypothetical protein